MTSTANDQSKPVTGYPMGYPPAATASYQSTAGYPNSTAGTAYPYAAPPPGPGPYYYPSSSYDNQRRRATFLRRLLIAALAVVVIIGCITFITWLVLRPRVPEFQLDSASVSSFNVSSSDLTANWDLNFTVRNPNKKLTVFYSNFRGVIFYDRMQLAETSLPPFEQGKRNQTTVRAKFAASSTYVDDNLAKSLATDRSQGAVSFNVRLVTWVKFKTGWWRTRMHWMSVHCSDVRISFKSNSGVGSLTGGPRGCDVYL
ncbi:NDR1/HIN1-like protein 10 [Macadamia integrifolia]|uniref:NDR1/HIN1-like protein 10 n=1 Tax=Macadamia integrifolia TaxID=60698 RepID=UPI001C5284CD|nr:NDR1/HIN1-like protein 10 [Macadamia integrifolia]